MQASFDANVDSRLKAIRAKLTDEQMLQIAADAAELERLRRAAQLARGFSEVAATARL